METPKQPGWYSDPYGDLRLLRYWDGQSWSGMTKFKSDGSQGSAIPNIPSNIKEPKPSTVNFARRLFTLADAFVKFCGIIILFFLACVFVDAFVPSVFQIGVLAPIRDYAAFVQLLALIGALVAAGIGMPIRALCQRILIIDGIVFQRCLRYREQASGQPHALDGADADEVEKTEYRIANMMTGCLVTSGIIAAFIGLITHDMFVDIFYAPWADVAMIALIAVCFVILYGISLFASLKLIEKKAGGNLFREARSSVLDISRDANMVA